MDPNVQEFFDDVLVHHGVKGQKWGVRRTPAQLGHKPFKSRRQRRLERGKQKLSGLRKKKTVTKQVVRRKRAAELNDEELAKAIKRLQMEKQYNELVNSVDGQARSAKGKSIVREFSDSILVPAAKEAGKEIIKNAIKDAAKKKRSSDG